MLFLVIIVTIIIFLIAVIKSSSDICLKQLSKVYVCLYEWKSPFNTLLCTLLVCLPTHD